MTETTMDDPFLMTTPFDAFEVAACYPLHDRDGEDAKRKGQKGYDMGYARADHPSDLTTFGGVIYSVYGHRPGYGVICIGDFHDAATARAVAESLAMTAAGVPVHDYIPDGIAFPRQQQDGGPKKEEEKEEIKWVLERELDE